MSSKIVTVNLSSSSKQNNKEYNDPGTGTEIIQPGQPKKRVVTTKSSWMFSPDDLSANRQFAYIEQIHANAITDNNACKLISQHINQKINGYKAQDIKKKLYDPTNTVDMDYVVNLLYTSHHVCFYCKESVQVLYENVREPKQWTLERIYNNIGHNKNNVEIACLQCNLGRKTMYHERYAFTKQLVIVKQH